MQMCRYPSMYRMGARGEVLTPSQSESGAAIQPYSTALSVSCPGRVCPGDWRRWDTTGKQRSDASTAWVLLP
jgi:hypothetical protein